MTMRLPVLCVEAGSGCWRLGFAGNAQPSCNLPFDAKQPCKFDHAAADDASNDFQAQLTSVDWWQRCLFEKLRVDPQEHALVIAEPLGSGPDLRQALVELMFETFNVAALSITPAPLLALYGGSDAVSRAQAAALTGVVVDCGLREVRIVSVLDGFVLHSALQRVPVGGQHVTLLVEGMLRDRGEPLPPGHSRAAAEEVKRRYSYVCEGDVQQELGRYEEGSEEQRCVTHQQQAPGCSVSVMQERFLGPELYFSPTLSHHTSAAMPLPQAVDAVIQACPIDCRRAMYGNILLAGGSAQLQGLASRLQRTVHELCHARMSASAKPIDVSVWSTKQPSHTTWLGASLLASSPSFEGLCQTREQYQERGGSPWSGGRAGV